MYSFSDYKAKVDKYGAIVLLAMLTACNGGSIGAGANNTNQQPSPPATANSAPPQASSPAAINIPQKMIGNGNGDLYQSKIVSTQTSTTDTVNINLVVDNQTDQELPTDYKSLTVPAMGVINFGQVSGVGFLGLPATRLILHANAVSADGSRHNWGMTGYSKLTFYLNSMGLGRAITWPGFTTLEVAAVSPTDTSAQEYLQFAQNKGTLTYTYDSHSLNYTPAKGVNDGSMQGTYIANGYIYEWCSYNQNKTLNKCENITNPEAMAELAKTSATNKTPTYYLRVTKQINNITKYSVMYALGDSLTDNHNIFSLTGGDMPRGPYYNGRWSNGLMWVDYIQLYTGLPVKNYAVGGMEITKEFDGNLSQASGRKEASTDVLYMPTGLPITPSLQDQVNIILPHLKTDLDHASDKKVLITFLMGGNDCMEIIDHPDDASTIVKNMVSTLKAQIENSLIKNLTSQQQSKLAIDLFTLPDITISTQLHNYLVKVGRLDDTKHKITDFNTGIVTAMGELKKTYPNIEINLVDANSWFDYIQEKQVQYQFAPNAPSGAASNIWGQDNAYKKDSHGVDVPTNHDSSNFMGYQYMRGENATVNPIGIGSIALDALVPYKPDMAATAMIADGLHPSSKLHFTIAARFIYENLLPSNFIAPLNHDKVTEYLSDLITTKGFTITGDAAAFDRLTNMSNQINKDPDFAGCAPNKTCSFRNGNAEYVLDDGFSPKTYTIWNTTSNPSCPHGHCSVFSIFSIDKAQLRTSSNSEYIHYFPSPDIKSPSSIFTIPYGSYSNLHFDMSTATSFNINTSIIQQNKGWCSVLAVTHGFWGSTDGRCYNSDYTVCEAGKGC